MTFNDEPFGAVQEAFSARLVERETWLISGVGCDSYLVIGSDRAMMIDTGMSRRNLREFVSTLTDLPISVVNTHGHFDHTGGNGFFDEVFMHPKAVADAKKVLLGAATDDFPLDYDIQTVTEGHVFDLGDRTLEVFCIGAHNPGSIALLDKKYRLLFTGDEVESAQVLLMINPETEETVRLHLENMRKLEKLLPTYDRLCPAHNGSPIVAEHYIHAFIDIDQRVLAGESGSTKIASPSFPVGSGSFPLDVNPDLRRFSLKGTSIIYDKNQIKS